MTSINKFCELHTKAGPRTILGYNFNSSIASIAEHGLADVTIVSKEERFSALGASRNFFERDLKVSYQEKIKPIADWNRYEKTSNPRSHSNSESDKHLTRPNLSTREQYRKL